ncbi:DHH family phosphoesterase [Ligilactobacillus equi]|uniref:Phosphoesterase, DHH family protein n=1 Tax=Ligilactobacillus equi DSM 15833 = JCM 10991 TaxID=1423740 RepID=A0A0R1TQ34_9LACO|nr:bifunctional oligoribonuclease/PAP phosphatase NrnA [Ligilactobacillus equi]KRL83305.1 phosphoesterase, DHH family protein [Ligilactobacillus equi DSM 15833 = JCM 10991]
MELKMQLCQEILSAEKIVILRHERPDFDALGAQLGLAQIIRERTQARNLNLKVGGLRPDELADFGEMDTLTPQDFTDSLLIVVDTANVARMDRGNLADSMSADEMFIQANRIIKLDHHPKTTDAGYPAETEELIVTSASSSSEIIADLFQVQGDQVSSEVITLLYKGIMGDTGRLAYAFSHTTMAVLAQMMTGFEAQILVNINHQLSVASLEESRMKGYIYEHLRVEGDTAWIIINQAQLKAKGWSASVIANFVNLLGSVEGVEKWVMCVQNEDLGWRLRLRSQSTVINVLAQEYAGGGHPYASGVRFKAGEEAKLMELITRLKTVK